MQAAGKLLLFLLLSPCFCRATPLKVDVSAESAILINVDSGAVLYEKNAHVPQYPASTTKIATAAYALKLKQDDLSVKITAEQDAIVSLSEEEKRRSNYKMPAHWLVPGGTHIGIKKGEELPLKSLLYGLMIASGNDAANVIAQGVAGTVPNYMAMLNAYLKEIGCYDTVFQNPHGLHHPDHKTTARDLALMTKEAMKDPEFCKIVSTTRYTRPKTNKQEESILVQTNKLLKPGKHYYSKAIGVKTGYTSVAKHNLVAAAKHEDRTLIAVLMKCEERADVFQDAIKLFEAAFNEPKVEKILLRKGPQKFTLKVPGATKDVETYLEKDLTIAYYPAEEPKVKCLLYFDSLEPPIQKNQKVGTISLQTEEGAVFKKAPLLAKEDVAPSLLSSLKKKWVSFVDSLTFSTILGILAVLLAVGIFMSRIGK